MRIRAVTIAMLALATLGVSAPTQAAGVDREDAVQTFERDVFVVVSGALQNPNAETAPSEPLYNENGAPLDLTWGEWQAGTATSRAIGIRGPQAPSTDIQLRLDGLVAGGVYSVFYGTFGPDSENPLCPNVERTLALPSLLKHQLPDRYSFVADSLGRADFHGRVEGALLDAQQVFISVIWHADGQTYGELPNRGEYFTQGEEESHDSYGDDAMRHVVVLQKWS